MKFNLPAFKKVRAAQTVGRVLVVDLPELAIKQLPAKVDTGAFSGALHASFIREIAGAEGHKQLSFAPLGVKKNTVTVDKFHKRSIKSSNGHIAVRYAFDTEVEIMGERYPITITLTNRSTMKYPMLIGRKFLRTHGFLVDVSLNNR